MSDPLPDESPPVPFDRASLKIKHFGNDAQLTLPEAAAVLDVSPSTFERLGVPATPWSSRGRRWRYGAILEHGRALEGG